MKNETGENGGQALPEDFFDLFGAGEPELLVTEAQEAALASFAEWMDGELYVLEKRFAHLAAPAAAKARVNLSLTRGKRKAK